ncbi:MAG: hypothetical protein J6T74_04615 [Clostridia bacterium]|nr:hypothetical protein [Clostridia bacterium]
MIDKYSEYLKNLDAEASMLLGSFNADDNYVFDEKIKAELIACNKLIESFKPDVITAKATIGTYVFKFYLYIQDGENDLKRVGLFLEEKSKLGLVDKNMISYVDSVVLKYSGDFYNQIKQIYHLFTADDSDGIDMANNNLQEIIKKLNLLKGKYELFIPLFLDLDKKYVIEMLALIKSSGRYGEMLLLNIKRLISEKGISKQQPNYWRELKLIVDKLLYENIGVFDKNTKEKPIKVKRYEDR